MSAIPIPIRRWRTTGSGSCCAAICRSPANPPSGCRFHTRCPYRQPTRCDTEVPELRVIPALGEGRRVACHWAEEIAAGTVGRGRPPAGGRTGPVSTEVLWRGGPGHPVGRIVVVAGPDSVRRLSWSTARGPARQRPSPAVCWSGRSRELAEYFAGSRREFDVPVDLGSLEPATRQVLLTLQEVPYGVR